MTSLNPRNAPASAAARPHATLIELTGVSVASRDDPDQTVVEDVNWEIRVGHFWVVAGAAGTGKSQLIETAAGLIPPVRGNHLLFGRPSTELSSHEVTVVRRRIGLVFPDGGRLFPRLTVAQNIGLPICYHEECSFDDVTPRVERLLVETELLAYADWAPIRLSRGNRQRAALARALALEPEVLFLDNPLSGLDSRQRRWWLRFLAGLARGHPPLGGRPVTIIATSDDLRQWTGTGQQFAWVKDKRWALLGEPGALAAESDPLLREMLAGATDDK